MNIEQYGIYILYTLIYIGCAVILKYTLNVLASKQYLADAELAGGNVAVGLRRTGAQFGLAIAMMGVLAGSAADSLMHDLMITGLYGLIAVVFVASALVTADKWVLPGIDNLSELKSANVAVGFVELGMLTATGIMAYASIVGDSGGLGASVAYFVAGQLTLVALVLFYEKLVLRHHNIVESIGKGKVTSGIYLGGKMIAYALILKSAIVGNGGDVSLLQQVEEYLLVAVSGMLLLYLFEVIIDVLIITSSKLADILAENRMVPAMQLAGMKIGVALILSNAVL